MMDVKQVQQGHHCTAPGEVGEQVNEVRGEASSKGQTRPCWSKLFESYFIPRCRGQEIGRRKKNDENLHT